MRSATKPPAPRKGMPSPRLDEIAFKDRYRQQFADPAFDAVRMEIERITEVAWDGYHHSRKSPVTRKAGKDFADPDYDLSVDWIAARQAVLAAQARYEDKAGAAPYPLINGSSRSEHTCPGEMSKSYRLVEIASDAVRRDAGRGGVARPVASRFGIRPQYSSLQGVFLDGGATLPLALLLLSEPFARPDPGLDERYLSDVGRSARHHDHHAR